jgi:hypothetical protein
MDLNALAQLSALVVAVLNAHAGPLALLNPTPDILTSPSHLASHLPRKQKTSLSSSLVILISCYLDGTLPFLLTRQRRDCLPCWNHVEEWLWYWPGSLRSRLQSKVSFFFFFFFFFFLFYVRLIWLSRANISVLFHVSPSRSPETLFH